LPDDAEDRSVRFTLAAWRRRTALRVSRSPARAGRPLRRHFHGWHDHVCFPAGGAPGIIAGIVEDTLVAVPNDLRQVEQWFASRNDIAALILEPTGATFGQIPTTGETLRRLRELTARYGVLLIFDEVISGFRCSPGGAQQFYGVSTDLTTLGKILAGGYPGAALYARPDVLRVLDYRRKTIRCKRRLWLIRAHTTQVRSPPPRALQRLRRSVATTSPAAPHARPRRFAKESMQRSAAGAWLGALTASSRISTSFAAAKRLRRFMRARLCGRPEGQYPFLELTNKIRPSFPAAGVDIGSWPGGFASAAHR
jgi:glutamate-1-semialdehyde 2,1-aminomutase